MKAVFRLWVLFILCVALLCAAQDPGDPARETAVGKSWLRQAGGGGRARRLLPMRAPPSCIRQQKQWTAGGLLPLLRSAVTQPQRWKHRGWRIHDCPGIIRQSGDIGLPGKAP